MYRDNKLGIISMVEISITANNPWDTVQGIYSIPKGATFSTAPIADVADTVANTTTTAAKGPGIFTKTIRFFDGDWAQTFGAEWREAKKAGIEFDAKKSYDDFFIKRDVTDITEKVADNIKRTNPNMADDAIKATVRQELGKSIKTADKGILNHIRNSLDDAVKQVKAKPGFLSKIPGGKFLGKLLKGGLKRLGPIMIIGCTAWNAFKEVQLGEGLWGVGKAIFRGVLDNLGFIGGAMLAGAIVGTGGLLAPIAALALGAGGSMLTNWVGSKICKLKSEEIEEAQEEQEKLAEEQAKTNALAGGTGAGVGTVASTANQNDPFLRDLNNWYNQRNSNSNMLLPNANLFNTSVC